MRLRVAGKTAFDDPCVCRCCGYHFTASNGLLKMTIEAFDEMKRAPHVSQLDQTSLACPKCHSADIAPEVS